MRKLKQNKNAIAQREWTKNNPDRRYFIQAKRNYGINEADLKTLILQQENKCAICKCDALQSKKRKRLVIDHCHKTGKVRAMLCYRCNIFIGYLEKNSELLPVIVEYIQRFKV